MNLEDNIKNFCLFLKNERRYSNNTVENYSKNLKIYFDYLKTKKINYLKINVQEIREYLKQLDDKKYSINSISQNLSSIRQFYNYLIINNSIMDNPFKKIRNPKKEKRLPNFLQGDEYDEIIKSINLETDLDYRNRLIIELIYATGVRVTELVNIKINDINIKEQEIKIHGKGNKERIVLFGEYAKEYIIDYLDNHRPFNNEYLLLNNKGQKLSRRGIELIIDKVVGKTNLKHKISPHVLRHTFATDMLNNGADLKSVQELLGHESLSTTQIYTHITNERLRSVYLSSFPRNNKNKK